jgi:hypothetical protein
VLQFKSLGDFPMMATFDLGPLGTTVPTASTPSIMTATAPNTITTNAQVPAGSQITVGGAAAPWFKTWWGMLGIGLLGFLIYKRYIAK